MKRKGGLSLPTVTLLVALFLGYSKTTYGQTEDPPSPLKVENPSMLYVDYRQYGKCPFSLESIDVMIDGILTRSRLKRTPFTAERFAKEIRREISGFRLEVKTNCDDDDDAPHNFNIKVGFGEYATISRPWGNQQIWMYHDPYVYGASGTYDPAREPNISFLKNAIRESVEDALTDYLKANFDL